jgi:hypothetical protein
MTATFTTIVRQTTEIVGFDSFTTVVQRVTEDGKADAYKVFVNGSVLGNGEEFVTCNCLSDALEVMAENAEATVVEVLGLD